MIENNDGNREGKYEDNVIFNDGNSEQNTNNKIKRM